MDPRRVLILGRSGRRLATAAAAAGYAPIVVDCFGDSDTRRIALTTVVIKPRFAWFFDGDTVIRRLDDLRHQFGPMPLVWGGGWESQPYLLAALASRWQLAGCSIATVFRISDPAQLQRIVRNNELSFPDTAYTSAITASRRLVKRRLSAGGFDINAPSSRRILGQREYWQQKIDGMPYSVAFIASDGKVDILGGCEPYRLQVDREHPWRFGGSVASPAVLRERYGEIKAAILRLHDALTLRGLCGIDFMIDDDGRLVVLELNVRPPATFDLVSDPGSAFRAHLHAEAYVGAYPKLIKGYVVCYAERPCRIAARSPWPDWVVDRPRDNTEIAAGMPICSIVAEAASVAATRELLAHRFRLIMRGLGQVRPAAAEPLFA